MQKAETSERVQVADIEVSRAKFHAEYSQFRENEARYNSRGIFCYRAAFPDLYFVFISQKIAPPPILFAIKVNYTNYDAEALSVQCVHPFTGAVLTKVQVPVRFWQKSSTGAMDILQGMDSMPAFFCIPGTNEYHNHHHHTGDSWFLYRSRGEGKLDFILDVIYNYSIPAIKCLQFTVDATAARILQNNEHLLQFNQVAPAV
jgi:hypothetical protein